MIIVVQRTTTTSDGVPGEVQDEMLIEFAHLVYLVHLLDQHLQPSDAARSSALGSNMCEAGQSILRLWLDCKSGSQPKTEPGRRSHQDERARGHACSSDNSLALTRSEVVRLQHPRSVVAIPSR